MPSCSPSKGQEPFSSVRQRLDAALDSHRSRCATAPVDAVNGEQHTSSSSMSDVLGVQGLYVSSGNGMFAAQRVDEETERLRKPAGGVASVTEKGQTDDQARCRRIAGAVAMIMQELGVDPEQCNLRDTPERYARALLEFTAGYAQSAEETLSGAVFPETYSDMVVERDIDIWSLCEHHMVPFFGKCHIAYIPQGRILGLSKLARVAEMYARRLQVQERLTRQIADCIEEYLRPRGVAVYIEATHLCMSMRGIRKTDARTTTITTRGIFAADHSLQQQFLDLVNR